MNVDVSYTLDKLGQYRELETDEKERDIKEIEKSNTKYKKLNKH